MQCKIDINKLLEIPEIFQKQKTQEAFWDNEYISKQMLNSHLDPNWDAASRKASTIKSSCEWMTSLLNLKPNDKVLDLGCGPGLYCNELSKNDLKITGIDYSKRSIEYAKKESKSIEYIYMDYLNINYENEFDMTMMINCDFGVLSEENSKILLNKIYKALKAKGYFVFDIFTIFNNELTTSFKNYSVHKNGGFWSPNPHIELQNRIYYNEENVSLWQYGIIENNGQINVYNLWERYYTIESISKLLNESGFEVIKIFSDLTGVKYEEKSSTLGIIVQKK